MPDAADLDDRLAAPRDASTVPRRARNHVLESTFRRRLLGVAPRPLRGGGPALAPASGAVAPPRQPWQMARASASAASAGFGIGEAQHARDHGAHLRAWLCRRRTPVIAAFTSLGVCRRDREPFSVGRRRQRDAARLRGAHDRARLCCAKTRSDRDRIRSELGDRRRDPSRRRRAVVPASGSSRASVRMTPTCTEDRAGGRGRRRRSRLPQRVGPGSIAAARGVAPPAMAQSSASSSACTSAGMSKLLKHVLHVVAVFQGVDQPEHLLARSRGRPPRLRLRHELGLRGVVVEPRLLEGGAMPRTSVARIGDDLEPAAVVDDAPRRPLHRAALEDVVLGARRRPW